MKAVGWLIFLFFTQLMVAILSSYYLPVGYSAEMVNETALGQVEAEMSAITGDNQFAILNLEAFNRFTKVRDVIIQALKPTGYFLESLFPGVLPSAFITGLNILWTIIMVVSGIEFLRGFTLK